jgi:predicted GTPase
MGDSTAQVAELEATINAVPRDTVLFGTPVDLRRLPPAWILSLLNQWC